VPAADPALAALAAAEPGLELRERTVAAGGLALHAVEAGPADGPPVVLLHGFPEFWWGWRRQLPALAAAGWRAIALDLPGYNLSDKPRGLGPYNLDRLAATLVAALGAIAPGPVPVVGHDWGGALLWWTALRAPERLARIAILNAPHPAVLRRALATSAEQRRLSRYMLLLVLPWLAERKLAAGGFRPFRAIFKKTARPGTFTAAELDRYAAAAARPGALRAMLAWYRAALWRPPRRPALHTVAPPLLLVWGADDAALGRALIAPSLARCARAELELVEGAGHWLHHEEPALVNGHLLAFLAGSR
jgi:pimeloyl-ACP methyl ester carboxylesterase